MDDSFNVKGKASQYAYRMVFSMHTKNKIKDHYRLAGRQVVLFFLKGIFAKKHRELIRETWKDD